MGGLEALQQLRVAAHYDEQPIIILTTSDQDTDRQRVSSLGVADYQVKPRTLEQMNRYIMQLKQRWLGGS